MIYSFARPEVSSKKVDILTPILQFVFVNLVKNLVLLDEGFLVKESCLVNFIEDEICFAMLSTKKTVPRFYYTVRKK